MEKKNNKRIVRTVMQNAAGCSAYTAMHLDLQCYLSGLEMELRDTHLV